MRSDRSRDALRDIRDNIRLAQEFTEGLDASSFAEDARTRYAVIRCLEIISEASRRVGEAVQARHPQLPWSQIASSGNIYRHEYEDVRPEVLWRTVREALRPLLAAVEAELGGER
ncbi:MAG: hypothetical protein JWR10_453 [Rubritepida sp.]|nr:hypothetical protein [Rubritepida sp.]